MAEQLRKCGHPLGGERWCPDCELAEMRAHENRRTERTAMTDTPRAEPMKKSPDEIRHLFNGNPLAAYEQGWRDRAAELKASRLPLAGTAPSDEPKFMWRCVCGVTVDSPLTDETVCKCADIYDQDWSRVPASPAPSDAAVQQPPREFWLLLHEWKDSDDEDRREWIEHRFRELFALATSPLPTAPAGAREAMEKAVKVLDEFALDAARSELANAKLMYSEHYKPRRITAAQEDVDAVTEALATLRATLAQKGDGK